MSCCTSLRGCRTPTPMTCLGTCPRGYSGIIVIFMGSLQLHVVGAEAGAAPSQRGRSIHDRVGGAARGRRPRTGRQCLCHATARRSAGRRCRGSRPLALATAAAGVVVLAAVLVLVPNASRVRLRGSRTCRRSACRITSSRKSTSNRSNSTWRFSTLPSSSIACIGHETRRDTGRPCCSTPAATCCSMS